MVLFPSIYLYIYLVGTPINTFLLRDCKNRFDDAFNHPTGEIVIYWNEQNRSPL